MLCCREIKVIMTFFGQKRINFSHIALKCATVIYTDEICCRQ